MQDLSRFAVLGALALFAAGCIGASIAPVPWDGHDGWHAPVADDGDLWQGETPGPDQASDLDQDLSDGIPGDGVDTGSLNDAPGGDLSGGDGNDLTVPPDTGGEDSDAATFWVTLAKVDPPGGHVVAYGQAQFLMVLTFDSPMNQLSVYEALSIAHKDQQTPVAQQLNWINESRVEIRINEPLLPATTYTVTLAATAKSQSDIPLQSLVNWEYLTGSAPGDPNNVTPLLGSEAVINLANSGTFEISGALDNVGDVSQATPSVELIVDGQPTSFFAKVSGSQFTFDNALLQSALIAGNHPGVADYAPKEVQLRVTNDYGPLTVAAAYTFRKDTQAPKLTAVLDITNEGLPFEAGQFAIGISEPVVAPDGMQLVLSPGGAAFQLKQPERNQLQVSPSQSLWSDTTYTVTLQPGIVDDAGNPLSDSQFTFYTVADLYDPNGTLADAAPIDPTQMSLLSGLWLRHDHDTVDIYKFALPAGLAGPYRKVGVQVAVIDVSGTTPVQMELAFLDADGKVESSQTYNTSGNDGLLQLSADLRGGTPAITHHLRVKLLDATDQVVNYQVLFTFTDPDDPFHCDAHVDPFEPSGADPVWSPVPLPFDATLVGSLCNAGSYDTSDLFDFTLSEPRTVTLDLKYLNVAGTTTPKTALAVFLNDYKDVMGDGMLWENKTLEGDTKITLTLRKGYYAVWVAGDIAGGTHLIDYTLAAVQGALVCPDDEADLVALPDDDYYTDAPLLRFVDDGSKKANHVGVLCRWDRDYRRLAVEAGDKVEVTVTTETAIPYDAALDAPQLGTCAQNNGTGSKTLVCTPSHAGEMVIRLYTSQQSAASGMPYTITVNITPNASN